MSRSTKEPKTEGTEIETNAGGEEGVDVAQDVSVLANVACLFGAEEDADINVEQSGHCAGSSREVIWQVGEWRRVKVEGDRIGEGGSRDKGHSREEIIAGGVGVEPERAAGTESNYRLRKRESNAGVDFVEAVSADGFASLSQIVKCDEVVVSGYDAQRVITGAVIPVGSGREELLLVCEALGAPRASRPGGASRASRKMNVSAADGPVRMTKMDELEAAWDIRRDGVKETVEEMLQGGGRDEGGRERTRRTPGDVEDGETVELAEDVRYGKNELDELVLGRRRKVAVDGNNADRGAISVGKRDEAVRGTYGGVFKDSGVWGFEPVLDGMEIEAGERGEHRQNGNAFEVEIDAGELEVNEGGRQRQRGGETGGELRGGQMRRESEGVGMGELELDTAGDDEREIDECGAGGKRRESGHVERYLVVGVVEKDVDMNVTEERAGRKEMEMVKCGREGEKDEQWNGIGAGSGDVAETGGKGADVRCWREEREWKDAEAFGVVSNLGIRQEDERGDFAEVQRTPGDNAPNDGGIRVKRGGLKADFEPAEVRGGAGDKKRVEMAYDIGRRVGCAVFREVGDETKVERDEGRHVNGDEAELVV
ncbi:hypothetical protein AURDEDRAFT_131743 [Auricularia subglabra TFB-10046 SS5]|uniref:Uncharacterized protein n=1 Tax=Auricularia subglabra (strain TFB-10046 / SS5) TaxID=717982 RepID=J0CSS4_AURST|nr:hypothetical protein AURDEDRAFT_131743 [Auricularia subglabra TFB-10046 SS5]